MTKINYSKLKNIVMEKIVKIHIEKLPDGLYLATSDAIQGLIAQGRTIAETLEIAKDVAKKLIEAQSEIEFELENVEDYSDYPILIGV